MQPTHATQRLAYPYLGAASVVLITGATIGVFAAVPHGWPGALQDLVPFQKMRPLHTTLSVGWIFLAYMGALFYFMPRVCGADWWSPRLAKLQLALLGLAGTAAVVQYLSGLFSGREYLDFVPAIAAVIGVAWIAFLLNFFKTLARCPRPWPVYLWMWATGLVLFTTTFVEGHLYLLPYFGGAFPRDVAVQWKSYGGLIGSWNLVVYGLSIYVAEQVAGDPAIGRSRGAFASYWLSVINLMLGFAHHTFPLPQSVLIRQISFATSMTEWALLGALLWTWTSAGGAAHDVPRRFLRSATFWIGVNLCLALLLSIPALNAVTHGTHVTIAHAMGSTIGINTLILMAAGFLVLLHKGAAGPATLATLRSGLWIFNAALLGFFACLLIAGAIKGVGMAKYGWSHFTAMELARPYLRGMFLCGVALWFGIVLLHGRWMRLLFTRVAPEPLPAPEPVRSTPRFVYAAVVFGVAAIPWWWPVADLPESGGAAIYRREGCAKCHGVDAPDLAVALPPRSEGWIRAKLFEPRWTECDSKMPSFRHLTESEAAALAEYVASLRRAPARAPAVDATPRPAQPHPNPWCLYMTRCSGCHGTDGRGDGPASRFLAGESLPRDFTRRLFRSRSTDSHPTDADLYRTITRGMPGTAMPSFAHIPPEERWALVDVVKSLARADAPASRDPLPPPPTLDLVARGESLAASMKCAACHGDDLRGLHRSAKSFAWTDEIGRPIWRSTDLMRGPFKCGDGPADFYRTIVHGMGGAPMPSFADALPDPLDRWALVYYLCSLAKSPAPKP